MDQFEKVPVCRVSHDQLLLFEQFPNGVPRSDLQRENEKNLTRGEFNGYMSPKTKAKVKKYLTTWIQSGNMIRNSSHKSKLDKVPYFTFVTLTLPSKQQHDDNTIKRKCLMPFIQTLQRSNKWKASETKDSRKIGREKWEPIWHYFWRAEPQKNGNIHFHLIVDSYIHHTHLRNYWNETVNKLGYVDQYEINHPDKGNNPNSTDIHALYDMNSPVAYCIKYCTKTPQIDKETGKIKEGTERKINGRIHGCSDGLRELTPYEQLIDFKMSEFVQKVADDKASTVIKQDEFVIIKCSTKQMIARYYPQLRRDIVMHHYSIAMHLYKIEVPPEIEVYQEKQVRKRLIQLELFNY